MGTYTVGADRPDTGIEVIGALVSKGDL